MGVGLGLGLGLGLELGIELGIWLGVWVGIGEAATEPRDMPGLATIEPSGFQLTMEKPVG